VLARFVAALNHRETTVYGQARRYGLLSAAPDIFCKELVIGK
jgi:hypothetical protein